MDVRHARFAAISCALILCSTCRPDAGSDDPNPPSAPATVPYVQSTVPSNQATGVLPTQILSVRFSEPMDPATISSASFSVATLAGTVAGAVSLSATNRDAYFAPAALLAPDTAYTATLTPAIRSAAGQPLQANHSWSFVTESPPSEWSWSVPALLETSPNAISLSNSGAGVALDDEENACAVWRQSDGSSNRIFASRSVAGGAWEDPVVISGNLPCSNPVVGMGGEGQIFAAWGSGTTIRCARAGPSGAWQASQLVAQSPTYNLIPVEIAVDSAGNAQLFYHDDQMTGLPENSFVIRCEATMGWQTPVSLPIYNLSAYRVAAEVSGFAAVVWFSTNPPGVAARRYLPGSGWTSTEILEPYEAGRQVSEVTVTTDGAGGCLAVWLKQIAGGSSYDKEIFESRSSSTAVWTQSEVGPSTSGHRIISPGLALAPDGSVMLTWVNQLGWRCWASRQDASGTWSAPTAIDLNTPNHSVSVGRPFFSGGGRVAVIGEETIYDAQAPYGTLWINQYDPATGWGSPSRLRTGAGYFSGNAVAFDSQGRAAVVWKESDAPGFTGGNDVWWSRFR